MFVSPVVVGLVAGLSSALLFVSAANGATPAVVLALAAPVPLFVAGLGFGPQALLIASAITILASGLILDGILTISLVASAVLPAIALTRLPALRRPVDPLRPDAGLEWYPPGRMVLWASGLGALIIFASVLMAGGDAEAFRAGLVNLLLGLFKTEAGQVLAPEGVDPRRQAEFLAAILPALMAATSTCTLLATLWISVKITAAIGRMDRPWPPFSSLEFPRTAATAFVLCLAVSVAVPGLIGLAAGLVAGGLFTAYTLLGLATIHRLTEGARFRTLFLTVVYVALVVLGTPALLIAGVGLADNAFGFRRRMPPTTPSS